MKTKGAIVYLLLTYVLGYAAQFLGFRTGILRLDSEAGLFNYLAFIAVMYVPALSAWLASLTEKREDVTGGAYWPLPVGKTVLWVLAMPVVFLVAHGITAVMGSATVSLTMGALTPQVNDALRGMGQPEMTPGVAKLALPIVALVAGIPVSMAVGATLLAGIALGSEIGWRGYLLPKLVRFGRLPAHVLTGLLWGLWFLPCLLQWLSDNPHLRPTAWVLLLQLLGMSIVVSVVLGEVWLRSHNMLLTALVLGSFLGQQFGVWSYLFESPRRPWAGGMGFVAIAVWLLVALVVFYIGRDKGKVAVPAAAEPEGSG